MLTKSANAELVWLVSKNLPGSDVSSQEGTNFLTDPQRVHIRYGGSQESSKKARVWGNEANSLRTGQIHSPTIRTSSDNSGGKLSEKLRTTLIILVIMPSNSSKYSVRDKYEIGNYKRY